MKIGIEFYLLKFLLEAISCYPFPIFCFLKKKAKGFPLLSGLGHLVSKRDLLNNLVHKKAI
jgi:hypothetical protein